MFKLKTDPDFPHHYIISVAIEPMTSDNAGQMILRYGPIHCTNKDLKNVEDALILCDDKIYREIYHMTSNAIYKMMGCNKLILSFIGINIASKANSATTHHFLYTDEIPNAYEFFKGYVKRANKSKHEREGLKDARI